MPLDTLLDALARDAAAEARRVVEDARAEAARTTAAARERTERRRRDALDARAAELRARAERERAEATLQARAVELRARDRLIGTVIEAARARLPAIVGEPCIAAAALRRAEQALGYWPAGEAVVVRCTPALEPRLIALAAARPGTTVVADESVPAGAVAESADGAAMVDGTLDGLLDAMRPALAIEIAALAAPPDDAPGREAAPAPGRAPEGA